MHALRGNIYEHVQVEEIIERRGDFSIQRRIGGNLHQIQSAID